ncbi:ChaN family lipoprotein [Psychrobacter sp. I-STPA10]|uniref:ChaN family lipoprotein n=1 Tax=Psychrobacter sp. I-STPA10 TaxID=2585769 RepID=UPI001E2B5289|nr:ChaN family lipoprotein [Psychrobacter sp. I-STPA10]
MIGTTIISTTTFAKVSILETKSLTAVSSPPATKMANPLLANSQIIDLANQKTITAQQFVQQLALQDYVILGEYHDSKAQHQLAYWLLAALDKQRPQGSLLLEMLTVAQQPLVDDVAQNHAVTLAELNKSLQWQPAWDWGLYGNIVQHPINHGYDLVATNLSKSEVSALLQNTQPVQSISANASTTEEIKSTIRNSIMANHHLDSASDEDMAMINRMVEIQQHRDRRMAEKILGAATPSLLLTGNFHAQKSVGVPVHLSDLQYEQPHKKQGVVVMMVADIDDLTTKDADYVWVINDE